AEALELLTQEGDAFPEQAVTALYLRSCLAARVGRTELALAILEDAIGRGFWYGEEMLRQSPSWQSLQGLPGFEHMAAICMARQGQARTGPDLLVEEPVGAAFAGQARPLFLALHGNGDRAARALAGWRPIVARGWLLAAPQSSQIGATSAYGWFDEEVALREVAEQYATLRERFAIAADHVLLAGFSMGGEIALRLALRRTIPARGFLLLGPGGNMTDGAPEAWLPLIAEAAATGLRGALLIGEEDANSSQDAVRVLAELLGAHGVPCMLETLPGLGHEYPD